MDEFEFAGREPEEVFDNHLHQGQHGTVEEDLSRNYPAEVVVLTGGGVYRGHDGVRELAARLRQELPDASFTYTAWVVDGEVALLEWAASTPSGVRVQDGVDSFVIRGGRIQAQTIHYTVLPPPAPQQRAQGRADHRLSGGIDHG